MSASGGNGESLIEILYKVTGRGTALLVPTAALSQEVVLFGITGCAGCSGDAGIPPSPEDKQLYTINIDDANRIEVFAGTRRIAKVSDGRVE